jgi:hypothetical protein
MIHTVHSDLFLRRTVQVSTTKEWRATGPDQRNSKTMPYSTRSDNVAPKLFLVPVAQAIELAESFGL